MPGPMRRHSVGRMGSRPALRRGGILAALALAAATLAFGSLLQPLTAGASLPKDDNPKGTLTYGIDLNDEFDNTFNPEQSLQSLRVRHPLEHLRLGPWYHQHGLHSECHRELVDDAEHGDSPYPARCRVLQR